MMQQVFRELVREGLLEVVGHRADGQVVYRRPADLSLDEWQEAWAVYRRSRNA
jgi:hypothetical protein